MTIAPMGIFILGIAFGFLLGVWVTCYLDKECLRDEKRREDIKKSRED